MLENSNEYMNRNKVEILSIEIYKLYVGFSLSVKTEEIRSFWLYFRKTLSLTEQNFYFVQFTVSRKRLLSSVIQHKIRRMGHATSKSNRNELML